jgi:type IV secretion system protein VirD4
LPQRHSAFSQSFTILHDLPNCSAIAGPGTFGGRKYSFIDRRGTKSMPSFRLFLAQGVVAVALIFAVLLAATQWAASLLGYAAALGDPLLQLRGLKIYAPWKLFAWWLAFGADRPDVFAYPGAAAALAGLGAGLIAIGGAAWRARHKNSVTTYGSARWAAARDVRRAGLFARRGVVLGTYAGRYLRHDGPEHILAVAPTRSGKGVGLVVPTLLTWAGSVIVHDVKGENWRLTAGWRRKFSTCLLFDPTQPHCAAFNPLLEVRKGRDEVRDVQNIADMLVDPGGAREPRDHWEKTAHALLTGAILHVLYAEAEKTLARVAAFLADPARSIYRTLWVMLTTNHLGTAENPKAHPVIASIARELLNKSENERSGVVSTAMSLLGLYRDPIIAANTSRSDWRIADLLSTARPATLYLVVPPSDLSRTRPLARLILNQIARRLTETLPSIDGASQRQLLLMLDEFPALGRLDFFESSLAFMGGYGVRAFLVAQSLHQIDRAYGVNHAILDNCHVRVAFAPNDEKTAKRLSDTLGTATELRAQKNLSGSRLAAFLPYMSISQQETPRPLLTAGEILQLAPSDALVLVSGVPPIRARKLKYFTDRNFLLRRIPAPSLTRAKFDRAAVASPADRAHDWVGAVADVHPGLATPRSERALDGENRGGSEVQRETQRGREAFDRHADLSLLAETAASAFEDGNDDAPIAGDDDPAVDFPGGVRV